MYVERCSSGASGMIVSESTIAVEAQSAANRVVVPGSVSTGTAVAAAGSVGVPCATRL